jgi:hypothetical protein
MYFMQLLLLVNYKMKITHLPVLYKNSFQLQKLTNNEFVRKGIIKAGDDAMYAASELFPHRIPFPEKFLALHTEEDDTYNIGRGVKELLKRKFMFKAKIQEDEAFYMPKKVRQIGSKIGELLYE